MPFVLINWVIIHPQWVAESASGMGASGKHDVGSTTRAIRKHAGNHVDIVVRRCPRTIHRQENLASQTIGVNCSADDNVTSQVDFCALIKARSYTPVLGVSRAHTPDLARVEIDRADKEIPSAIYIERAPRGRVRNIYRVQPGKTAIGRTRELPGPKGISAAAPALVLKAATRAVCSVDRKPLLISALSR